MGYWQTTHQTDIAASFMSCATVRARLLPRIILAAYLAMLCAGNFAVAKTLLQYDSTGITPLFLRRPLRGCAMDAARVLVGFRKRIPGVGEVSVAGDSSCGEWTVIAWHCTTDTGGAVACAAQGKVLVSHIVRCAELWRLSWSESLLGPSCCTRAQVTRKMRDRDCFAGWLSRLVRKHFPGHLSVWELMMSEITEVMIGWW